MRSGAASAVGVRRHNVNDVIMIMGAASAASAVGARRHNENDVTVVIAGRRYGDWRHVATGCTALVLHDRPLERKHNFINLSSISLPLICYNHSNFGRPLQGTVRPSYGTVVLSVLSVCDVVVLQRNGWTDQDATWYDGRSRAKRHCVRWEPEPSSPNGKGNSTFHFSAYVYNCVWMKVNLPFHAFPHFTQSPFSEEANAHLS